MACVDRKDILLDFLTPTWSQEREDAIGILSNYAVVTRRPAVSALDLHRLVHLAVRRWIEKHGSLDEWTQKAIKHLVEVFPDHHHENRSKWRRLLPHAKYALSYSPLNPDNDDRTDLASRCAMSLCEDGRHNEAEELEVQVMEIRKKKLGVDHPDTLTSTVDLAFTLKGQGRDEDAIRLMDECVSSLTRVLGAHHHHTISSAEALVGWRAEQLDINEGIV